MHTNSHTNECIRLQNVWTVSAPAMHKALHSHANQHYPDIIMDRMTFQHFHFGIKISHTYSSRYNCYVSAKLNVKHDVTLIDGTFHELPRIKCEWWISKETPNKQINKRKKCRELKQKLANEGNVYWINDVIQMKESQVYRHLHQTQYTNNHTYPCMQSTQLMAETWRSCTRYKVHKINI